MNIGKMEVKNRFIRSAVMENMAKETGEVTNELIKTFTSLAKGEVGLIITGFMYVHPLGKAYPHQTGIHNDDLIPSLRGMVDAIHQANGKVAFQLGHAGLQTDKNYIGTLPIGPSKQIKNPFTFTKPKEMTEEDIQESIEAFTKAAIRASEAGADAIQLHGAHGYLISEFISPFYNRRKDNWGGTDENRFRYLKKLISSIKKVIPRDMALLVKLSSIDYTPKEGNTPSLVSKYAKWLKNIGIDGIEISAGSATFAIFNMSRGDVPVKEIIQNLPDTVKPLAEKMFQDLKGKFDLVEGYNLEAAKVIKPSMGDVPLILVGGMRTKSYMENILEKKYSEFISMARPFIREPYLIRSFKDEKQEKVACISCNRCLAAVPNHYPVRCYAKKWPEKTEISIPQ
jgi:2,4-dienoyl-CoA reductase-like NADH-dependent reductase (Old Yellow Enzyme family)